MSKKRDMDRLGHYLLKYIVIETKNYLDEENLRDRVLDTVHLISAIMAKVESSESFKFSKKDSIDMSISDICNVLKINVKKYKSDDETTEAKNELAELVASLIDSIETVMEAEKKAGENK